MVRTGDQTSAVLSLGLIEPHIGPHVDVLLLTAFGLASGYMVMQYADVRAAYSASLTGRALTLLNDGDVPLRHGDAMVHGLGRRMGAQIRTRSFCSGALRDRYPTRRRCSRLRRTSLAPAAPRLTKL